MSTLQEKIAEALFPALDPMCASTGEAEHLADVALAVVREHLLSDGMQRAAQDGYASCAAGDASHWECLKAAFSAALDGDA